MIHEHSLYSPISKEYMNLTDKISTTQSTNNLPPHIKTTKDEHRPCLVCGEKAGKHSYYGGQVCPSCRAFFRRSVQSGYNASYFCPKDNNCKINLKTRKSCQFCRYKLCEAAGMKTAWVLTEDERRQKSEGRNKRKISPCSNNINQEDLDIPCISSSDLTTIDRCVKASSTCDPTQLRDMDISLIRQIIR